jgi:hypothetical protein
MGDRWNTEDKAKNDGYTIGHRYENGVDKMRFQ